MQYYDLVASTSKRNVKKGTSRYQVGISPEGYHRIWKQGDQSHSFFKHIFSFWAFNSKQQGTIAFSVMCNSSYLDNDCIMVEATTAKQTDYQHDFTFWVFPTEVLESQEVIIRSKPKATKKSKRSTNPPTFPAISTFSFWVPKFGNEHGNIIYISKTYIKIKNYFY